MDENMVSAVEINSIAFLNKKRKIQAELLGTPSPKHVCCAKKLERDLSSDLTTEQKKATSALFATQNSSSFHSDPDSIMSTDNDANNYLSYPKTSLSVETSEISLYSLESRSMTKASSVKSESVSVHDELTRLYHEYGFDPSVDYEDHLLEFGNHDCTCSENQTDTDPDELLYSNEVASSSYVLSSGRWSVNQDAQQGTRKKTIDKEFEEYFSMLML